MRPVSPLELPLEKPWDDTPPDPDDDEPDEEASPDEVDVDPVLTRPREDVAG